MRLARVALGLVSWLVLGFLALPVLVVVPLSLSSVRYYIFPPPGWSTRWYTNFFASQEWHAAIAVSLGVGVMSTAAALVLGTLAALGLAQASFRGKSLVYAAILSPLMVPTIIIAIALYFSLAPLGLVGSPIAIALGHVALGTPYVAIVVAAALERFDPMLERAALSLGAHPLTAFRRVTLPIIRPALLAASFLAFLASFDELIIALFLSGPEMRTLPVQMWRGIRLESDPTIAAVSTLLIGASALVFLVVSLTQLRMARTSPTMRT